ncbi:MAG: hypothetical protein ACRDQ5_11265, partial [Sciscionella sp.]
MQYFVQYGAGLGALVDDALKEDFTDANFLFQDGSGVVFETRSPADRVADLAFAKNVFEVIGTAPRGSIPGTVEQIVKTVRKRSLLRDRRRGASFRTMVNIDGQLVGLPRELRARLESVIVEQTGGQFNARGGSGVEYWIVGRRGLDVLMFCQKLTVGAKKAGDRGSLSSDLAV